MKIQHNEKSKKTEHRTKDNWKYYLEDDEWRLSKNVIIPIKYIFGYLEADAENSCIKTLSWFSDSLSASHVHNMFYRFLDYLESERPQIITTESLINYKSKLDDSTIWYLGTIRVLLRKWHRLGYSGISDEVISLLKEWKLSGNIKGDAIKRRDPVKGPLSDIELQAFNECAVQLYEKNKISLDEMAMALITSHTGRRPIQVSHLRVKDVLLGKNKSNGEMYFINIPKAKQQDGEFRGQLKQFAITGTLYSILVAQANSVISKVQKTIKHELQDYDKMELPLFPDSKEFIGIKSPIDLRRKLQNELLHIKSAVVSNACKSIVNKANIISERTGEKINGNSRRFRYTTGTRAAREGYGVMIIAELLDQKDTQNAGVYIKNIPDHVERLDAAVGHRLAPYAQAFAGMLVNKESDAVRGNELSSRIKTHGQGIGTCGSYGFCGANVPIPCYTCIHFQPWLDGPHEIVYEEMIAERERLITITGDQRIAEVNDRTILAVADVIQRCAARRKELENG